MKARFEYWRGADGQWYWRLRARNGRILAVSEGYRRRAGALRGIAAARAAAAHPAAEAEA